jgi:hypothetical protein
VTRIDDPLFSGISGKVGNEVYRKRKNGTFSYRRPDSIIVSQTVAAVNSRRNFSAASKLSSALRKDPLMKQIWEKSDIPASSAFHKMVSYNNRRTFKQNLTLENAITPPGVPLNISSVGVNNSSIEFALANKNKDCIDLLRSAARFYVCIYAITPNDSDNKLFLLLLNSADITELQLPSVLSLPLPGNQMKEISKFDSCIIYIAAAKINTPVKPVMWTSTSAHRL